MFYMNHIWEQSKAGSFYPAIKSLIKYVAKSIDIIIDDYAFKHPRKPLIHSDDFAIPFTFVLL